MLKKRIWLFSLLIFVFLSLTALGLLFVVKWHFKPETLMSQSYMSESGQLKLNNHPNAINVGGKAFTWFVEEDIEASTDEIMVIKLYSGRAVLQGKYAVSKINEQITAQNIIFFNIDIFTFSDGSQITGKQIE